MDNIGTNIARLRREYGMTQETLAEMIGVNNSTVSKWETSAYAPDVSLLPVIADVFGVSLDALFGRAAAKTTLESDQMYDAGMDALMELIGRMGTSLGAALSAEKYREKYEECAAEHPEMRSLDLCGPGVFYFRKAMGAMLLKRPENGWRSLLSDEKALRVLHLLTDEDFRRALRALLENKVETFTLTSLSRISGLADASHAAELLVQAGYAAQKTLEVDGQNVRFFQLQCMQQLMMPFAILSFAKEAAE